jgi:transcriptional regulator with XRE-family HTH domain
MDTVLNNVKIAILKKHPTQFDFAEAVKMHNTFVSHVLRGRRRLSKEQAEKWLANLQCDPEILKPVTKSK